MARLVALDLPGGPGFVTALRRVWDRGDAAFPLDQRLPQPAREAMLAAMAPASVIDADGVETALDGGRAVEPGDALVVATSGSTGTPRGVVLTHDAVAASATASSRRLAVTDNDHWLACLPLSHVGGLAVVSRAIHTGTRLTVLRGPEPAAIATAVDNGATLVSLVPAVLDRVDISRFRAVLLGGSSPPADRAPNTIATYGMTETGSGIVYDGLPLDGVELRTDPDGVLWVRGAVLLRAYRDGTVPLDEGGWFRTGDVGAVAPDGTVHVEGREGDLIVTGGENVWPSPVEDVLASHPLVAEVAVSGRPDPEWGQIVVAWVVPADRSRPPTLGELRAHVKESLPAFAAPRALELVWRLPRTGVGKVSRSQLTQATKFSPS
jgi:O-succinylbenzoic acid--CoA ligase